jgi:anaerobic selenocysteine-containing dehydrogenase
MSKYTRRTFIKLTGITAAAAAGALGTRAIHAGTGSARLGRPGLTRRQIAAAASTHEERHVHTACALCPSGCGLRVRIVDGRAVKVEGNPLHPLNQGVCCLRGQASLETLYSPERIQRPRIQTGPKGGGDWREISWDEALALVTEKLAGLRQAGLAHTVVFLHGETRGSMRGLINRWMTAYGSPNTVALDTPGEHAARLAMLLSQGINGYPIYDLNNANYAIAFGGNLLETSRHVIGHLAALAFMRRGRPTRGKLVSVHGRLSLTGVKADEWAPIRPGTEGALALGMANVIINSNLHDADFVRDFTFGFEDFTDAAGALHTGFKRLVLERYTLERVAFITGVPAATIARLAGEFATNRPAVAILPVEPDGLSLYDALAVHALNALVGSIDVKGGVLVQRFPTLAEWPAAAASLAQPRRDAVVVVAVVDATTTTATTADPLAPLTGAALAARLGTDAPYPINAVFLYNANPVYESPAGGRMAEALLKAPFVVSFAATLDESAAHADLILPASSFLEIWGDDFIEGAGYPGVSLRQPVVEPVHDTRNPGDVLLQLAAKLGGALGQTLPFSDYRSLVEHRLSAIDMDQAKFAENGVWSEMVYFNAQPGSAAWPNVVGRDRLNAPQDGRFDFFSRELFALLDGRAPAETPAEGQAQDIAPTDLACLPHFTAPDETAAAGEYPFLLIAQGLITQPRGWQGIVPALQECYGLQANMKWKSWVEIGPAAARSLGVANGDLVWVESPAGKVQAVVRIYAGLWPNAVYLPPGLGHRTQTKWGRDSLAPTVIGANVNQLLASAGVTRVRIYKV